MPKFHHLFRRPMTELEQVYNKASRKDGTLNGHFAGLLAVAEYGAQLERDQCIDKLAKDMLCATKRKSV